MDFQNVGWQLRVVSYALFDVVSSSEMVESTLQELAAHYHHPAMFTAPWFARMLEKAKVGKYPLTLIKLNYDHETTARLVAGFGIVKDGGEAVRTIYASYVTLNKSDHVKRRGHAVLLTGTCYKVWFELLEVFTHEIEGRA